ncbi:MAG TPA: hypothetical protein VLA43_15985, partial [Longimicrobiales bacterium]|nr:hypothetical protein [Longimicrobiales bacterium]
RRIRTGLLAVMTLAAGACADAGAQQVGAFARDGMAAARPLLDALERFRAERGRYPQYLDDLTPRYLEALPAAGAGGGSKQPFVYRGQGEAFELFFLDAARKEDQFLYRSTAEYPERLEAGPYTLVRRVEAWAWYRLLPMRPVKVVREWRGRVGLERKVQPVPFVADAQALKTLWEEWGLTGTVPSVDFGRHLLVVGVARSSLVMCMGPVLDDQGDLKPNVVATPDYPAFWSYALCLVERAGVRSVGGVPL